MSVDWNELQAELYPIKDYDDLRRRWQDAFAYSFVRNVYNFTIPAIATYTHCLLGGDTRSRYTEYVQRLAKTFHQLEQAGVQNILDLITQVDTRDQFETFVTKTDVPAKDLIAVLKYLVYWFIPTKKQLGELIRADSPLGDAIKVLRQVGIRTNLDLLQRGSTQANRQLLIKESGLPEGAVHELVNRADFSRMPWASKATISNIIGAGYGSLAELANANPEQLYADFYRYGASIGKNLKSGNEIDNSYRIAQMMPVLLQR